MSTRAIAARLVLVSVALVSVASSASAQSSDVVNGTMELAELEAQDAELATRHGERHPSRLDTRARIERLRASLSRPTAGECARLAPLLDRRRESLEAQRRVRAQEHGPRHPVIRSLDARIESLRRSRAALCGD
jgi:uncharacterized protein involved in exopolysaccharide biosynthesis